MSNCADEATVEVEWPTPNIARVILSGRLVAAAWPSVRNACEPILRARPRRVEIDASGLLYCDDSGLDLLAELRRAAATVGAEVLLIGLSEALDHLVWASVLPTPFAPQLDATLCDSHWYSAKWTIKSVFREVSAGVVFIGVMISALAWAAVRPSRVRWRNFWQTYESVVLFALPMVCVLSSLIGLFVANSFANMFSSFSVLRIVLMIASNAFARGWAPLISTIVVAFRAKSAFAPEINTTTLTEDCDALPSLDLPSAAFLAIPRVLAIAVMVPFLTVFANVFGAAAIILVMVLHGYSPTDCIAEVEPANYFRDVFDGLFVTPVFGLIVAFVGCERGLRTQSGSDATKYPTFRVVVTSLVLAFAVSQIFSAAFRMMLD